LTFINLLFWQISVVDLESIYVGCLFSLLVVCVLVGFAFLVLLERRALGYVHIRKGPNRVVFVGLFQPFRDAIRLFSKERYFPLVSNYLSYYFFPVFSLFLSLLVAYVLRKQCSNGKPV
jgi:NADH-ubiquinone oxidoreductase chain 1